MAWDPIKGEPNDLCDVNLEEGTEYNKHIPYRGYDFNGLFYWLINSYCADYEPIASSLKPENI